MTYKKKLKKNPKHKKTTIKQTRKHADHKNLYTSKGNCRGQNTKHRSTHKPD